MRRERLKQGLRGEFFALYKVRFLDATFFIMTINVVHVLSDAFHKALGGALIPY
jgi:hypothetical protein